MKALARAFCSLIPLAACAAAAAAAADPPVSDAPGTGPVTALHAAPAIQPSETYSYERFGKVYVYRPRGAPRDLVLFLSGDGGWNLGVLSMTERLVRQGAIVVGIDNRRYLAALERSADKCVSPAIDLENLSHFVQSKLDIRTYLQPALVGYSSGASLAYATLTEAPEGLFKGVLTLGFCTELGLAKPLCRGSGVRTQPVRDARGETSAVRLVPAAKISSPWISLQGAQDQVCRAQPAQAFIDKVPGAQAVILPLVGHGYAVQRHWGAQFDAAFERVTGRSSGEGASNPGSPVADLPLTVIPAAGGEAMPWFAVFLSGDGGWVGLDKGVSQALAKQHIPVVGWDSLKYFWSPRTPEGAAQDLARVIDYYAGLWGKAHVLLVGYSQGADTLPFMVNRLPAGTRRLVGLTALLGLSSRADFQFHFANWLRESTGGLPTAPELARWSGSPYLCLYGAEDRDAVCPQLTGTDGTAAKMAGGHHFSGGYRQIAAEILRRLPQP